MIVFIFVFTSEILHQMQTLVPFTQRTQSSCHFLHMVCFLSKMVWWTTCSEVRVRRCQVLQLQEACWIEVALQHMRQIHNQELHARPHVRQTFTEGVKLASEWPSRSSVRSKYTTPGERSTAVKILLHFLPLQSKLVTSKLRPFLPFWILHYRSCRFGQGGWDRTATRPFC